MTKLRGEKQTPQTSEGRKTTPDDQENNTRGVYHLAIKLLTVTVPARLDQKGSLRPGLAS